MFFDLTPLVTLANDTVVTPVTTGTFTDIINSIVDKTGTILVALGALISAILSVPGISVFLKNIKIKPQADAAQELLGVVTQKVLANEQNIKTAVEAIYQMNPGKTKEELQKLYPFLLQLEQGMGSFEQVVTDLKPKLHSNVRSAIQRV